MNLYLFYGDNKTIINDKIKKMIEKYNIEENNETMQIEILNTSLELDQYS